MRDTLSLTLGVFMMAVAVNCAFIEGAAWWTWVLPLAPAAFLLAAFSMSAQKQGCRCGR